MANLHLMSMNSVFDEDLVIELNSNIAQGNNLFVLRSERKKLNECTNCIVNPNAFNAQFINENEHKYSKIFLHSLFLNNDELFKLSEASRNKIVWIVWGHDLYDNTVKKWKTLDQYCVDAIQVLKKVVRGTYIKILHEKRKRAEIISSFNCIGIGYKYDELMIRKKYGNTVKVVYAPYFSRTTEENVNRLRKMHEQKEEGTVHILIGHSGFDFLRHEKYLKKLAKYKNENIHIHLILSYGASDERIKKISDLAFSIFGKEKCTIVTEMMPKVQYYEYLTKMDIAIFPFKHQSALGNTKRLAYMGVKLYLDPHGILYKGFKDGGVKTYNCHEIGIVSFDRLCRNDSIVDINAPLFETFDYKNNVAAWRELLSE